jgi:hypothetical protein
MRASRAAVVWVTLWLIWPEPGRAQPVAIVTEVDGSVRVVQRGRTVRPQVTDPIDQGATVALEANARIVLAYPGAGSVYELRGPGQFVARSDAVESTGPGRLVRRDLVSALRALRIRPEGTTLQGSAAMRGTRAFELQADGPTGSQFARDALRLCWKSLGALWTYRIRVIDEEGLSVFDANTTDSRFELPATLALQANAQYLWHVRAKGPNGQSADAAGQFRRLDPDRERILLQAQSALARADATDRELYRIALSQQGFVPGASACTRVARP